MKKKTLITLTVLFAMLNSFGQSKVDTALVTYAKNNGYAQLTDSLHLPKIMKSYYNAIIAYLKPRNIYSHDYYVHVHGIRDSQATFVIPLSDVSSVAERKKAAELNAIYRSQPDTNIINGKKMITYKIAPMRLGNLSGHDGELVIDKNTKQVKFLLSK